MADETETPAPAEPVPPAAPAPPDWFHQIPFDPKKGLDSVLPMELPDGSPLDAAHGHHAAHDED